MFFETLTEEEALSINGGFNFTYVLGAAVNVCAFAACVAAAPVTMGASVVYAGAALTSLTGVGVCTAFAFGD